MKTQGMNLFIVDDNRLMVADLRQYLQSRFGASLKISTFDDGESCLAKVDKQTDVVILDYFMEGKNGLEVLKSIKAINPLTEVIMLSGNEDIALAIETFRNGAKDYVIKGRDSLTKITKLVGDILTKPIKLLVKEFGLSVYMATFLVTFVSMAIIVLAVLHYIK
jgi:two-component system response regulator AtoC